MYILVSININFYINLGGAAPTMVDTNILMAPNRVDLPSSMMEARVCLSLIRVLVATTINVLHTTVEKLGTFVTKMRKKEVALGVYVPRNQTLVGQVPALTTHWVQIQ